MRSTHCKYHFSYILLIGLVILGCDKVEPLQISNDVFSLELWSDWKYQQGQGYDSYVGIFTNGHEEIKFDVGDYAFSSVAQIQQTTETLYFEETIIDNRPAKIVKEPNANGTILILYIDNDLNSLRTKVYIFNPGDDQKYIDVFKSFKFL